MYTRRQWVFAKLAVYFTLTLNPGRRTPVFPIPADVTTPVPTARVAATPQRNFKLHQ